MRIIFNLTKIFFGIVQKQSESKTQVDEEISKLCAKYLTRANKQFIKYEMLYFRKESLERRTSALYKERLYLS